MHELLKRGPILVFWILTGLGCSTVELDTDPSDVVTIEQLARSPERYHGKELEIEGILRIEFEGDILYRSRGEFETRNTENAIWVGYGKELEAESDLVGFDTYYAKLRPYSGKHVRLRACSTSTSLGTSLAVWGE
jgi:hypothetical protein